MKIIKTYKSESNILPLEWDMTSSKTLIYHNYNIEQIERQSDFNSQEQKVYIYNVDEYQKDEYIIYIMEKNKIEIEQLKEKIASFEDESQKMQQAFAKIDYISIMTGVDLL